MQGTIRTVTRLQKLNFELNFETQYMVTIQRSIQSKCSCLPKFGTDRISFQLETREFIKKMAGNNLKTQEKMTHYNDSLIQSPGHANLFSFQIIPSV